MFLICYLGQSSTSGPRQAWHDLHCKIEGPAAYDILKNHEQRWRKATKWHIGFKKVKHWHDDTLIRLDRIPSFLVPSTDPEGNRTVGSCEEGEPENWHVQVGKGLLLLRFLPKMLSFSYAVMPS